LCVGAWIREAARESVVGEASADGVEVVMTLFQRVEEVTERRNFDVARFFKARDPGCEGFGLADGKRGVGTERRIHSEAGG
jgi:hypothetical protein